MVGRSRNWFLFLLFGVFAVLALPGRAWAQASSCTIAMSTTAPVLRVNDSSGRTSSTTDPTLKLTLTRGDCLDDKLTYKFALTVTGYVVGWQLEAWAGRNGSDCAGEFTGSDNLKTCWKLGNLTVTNMVATAEYTSSQILGVDPQALYGGSKRILTACDDTTNKDKGRQQFNVYFFITYSNAVQCKQTQVMYYSLWGPDAPEITSVNSADSALEVEWKSIVASLTTNVNYEFYCSKNEDPGGCKSSKLEAVGVVPESSAAAGAGGASSVGGSSAGSSSAGNGGTAGSLSSGGTTASQSTSAEAGDAGASAGSAGSSSAGAAGDVTLASNGGDTSTSIDSPSMAGAAGATNAPTLGSYLCGVVEGKANTSGFTEPSIMALHNDTSYAITMGVRDTYGNLGTLAPYQCKTPRQVDTFFEAYNKAGGEAGGGFCNCDIRRKHGALPVTFGALGLVAFLRRRRQNPRRQGHTNSETL